LKLAHPEQQIAFEEYVQAVEAEGIPGPGADRKLLGRTAPARGDQQSRQRLGTARADRSRLGLSASSAGHPDSIARRQSELPKAITDIAWKAQLRLCSRFRKLAARGVNRNKLVTAIARELAGFVWAIGRQVPPCAAN
jgi:hypothetical protein